MKHTKFQNDAIRIKDTNQDVHNRVSQTSLEDLDSDDENNNQNVNGTA